MVVSQTFCNIVLQTKEIIMNSFELTLRKKMETMTTIPLRGKTFVLRPIHREHKYDYIQDANFERTGMACVGVLRTGETLEHFKLRWKRHKIKNYLNN